MMENKYRTIRNIVISLISSFYLISISLSLMINLINHYLKIQILSSILLIFISLIIIASATLIYFFYRKYLKDKGIKTGIKFFSLEYKIRKHLLDADYYFLKNSIFGEIAMLPKIIIKFENEDMGKIYIENSVRFDRKLEEIRLSSALNNYVVENFYISKDSNYYIYHFYNSSLDGQFHFMDASTFFEYGNLLSQNELFIDKFNKVPVHHMLLVGQTGSGKTYALFSLILQLIHKNNEPILYFADTKNAGTTALGKIIANDRTASSVKEIIELLERFNIDLQARKAFLENAMSEDVDSDYYDLKLSPQIFIFDEFADFHLLVKTQKKEVRDRVDALLSTIVLQGRQLGFFIWITMQKSDATLIPTYLRDNLVFKVVLGNAERTTYQTAFGIGVEIPKYNFSVGQGVYTYPGIANKPKICSFSHLDFNIIKAFKENARIVNTGVPKNKESENERFKD